MKIHACIIKENNDADCLPTDRQERKIFCHNRNLSEVITRNNCLKI